MYKTFYENRKPCNKYLEGEESKSPEKNKILQLLGNRSSNIWGIVMQKEQRKKKWAPADKKNKKEVHIGTPL